MIEQFEKLPGADQKKILGACLEEFGEKGYERASTNSIVKKSGIPKGTLFYFFGSKKQLFLYLVDYAVNRYVDYVNTYLDTLPSDLFERLTYMAGVRMRFAAHSPSLYRFFFRTLLNIPETLQADMQERFKMYSEENQNLMREGLDISQLKESVSVDQVMELLNYMMEGLLAQHTDKLSMMEPKQTLNYVEKLLAQSTEFFELIKNGVYKK